MLLSVITVNLNNSEGLQKTFDSISNQTYKDFEYIVIDGASSDGSTNLMVNNTRINYWISEKDNGVYDAMNKGILQAKGDYLLFLNSGDYLADPNVLSDCVPQLTKHDIIYGNIIFSGNGQDKYYTYPEKLRFYHLFTASLGHPSTFIKKDLFQKYGLYDLQYPIIADWVFFLETIAKHRVSTKYIHKVISVFDVNGMSSDSANKTAILEDRNRYIQQEFPLFYEDYRHLLNINHKLRRIQSSKGFKWLKALGSKKFQD